MYEGRGLKNISRPNNQTLKVTVTALVMTHGPGLA